MVRSQGERQESCQKPLVEVSFSKMMVRSLGERQESYQKPLVEVSFSKMMVRSLGERQESYQKPLVEVMSSLLPTYFVVLIVEFHKLFSPLGGGGQHDLHAFSKPHSPLLPPRLIQAQPCPFLYIVQPQSR